MISTVTEGLSLLRVVVKKVISSLLSIVHLIVWTLIYQLVWVIQIVPLIAI